MTSFPEPLSPVIENGHIARRHPFDGAHHGLQGGALKNRGRSATHSGDRAAKGIVFLLLLHVFQRTIEGYQNRLQLKRLGNEMKGAAFGGLHRRFIMWRSQ